MSRLTDIHTYYLLFWIYYLRNHGAYLAPVKTRVIQHKLLVVYRGTTFWFPLWRKRNSYGNYCFWNYLFLELIIRCNTYHIALSATCWAEIQLVSVILLTKEIGLLIFCGIIPELCLTEWNHHSHFTGKTMQTFLKHLMCTSV